MTWRRAWDEGMPRRFGLGRAFGPAPVTRGIVAACVAVTLISAIVENWIDPELQLWRWLALTPENRRWVYPFFTCILPHATYHPLHIVLNMVVLWYLGQELEARLGRSRYLTLFLGAALAGSLAHLLLAPFLRQGSGALMGASGGIFGLIFFIARETPGRPFVFYLVPVPAGVLAFLLVVLESWPVFFSPLDGDNVAHLAHLGGAAFGFWYLRHPLDPGAAWARLRESGRERSAARAAAREAARDGEMDRILRKIHEQGMPSLTDHERRFLAERSAARRTPPRR